MEKNYKKKFRLVYISTNRVNDNFEIKFMDNTDDGGYYYNNISASEETFDTEDEAIEFALNSDKWNYLEFTLIPIYTKIFF